MQVEFTDGTNIWRLIGTESVTHEVNTFKLNKSEFREHILVTSQDTFKSDKGIYKTYMRYTVDIKFHQGVIKLINQKKPN